MADPSRKSRYHHEKVGEKIEKGCLTCHAPHGGKNEFFFRQGPVPDMCWSCHKDRQHTHVADISIVNTDRARKVRLVDSRVTCVTCHHPHDPPPEKNSLLWFCSSCHGKDVARLHKNYHKIMRKEEPGKKSDVE
jgi:predicted CXXCH cytochrome family protein